MQPISVNRKDGSYPERIGKEIPIIVFPNHLLKSLASSIDDRGINQITVLQSAAEGHKEESRSLVKHREEK